MLFVVHGNGTELFAAKDLVIGAFLMRSDAENFLLTLAKDTYEVSEVDGVWKYFLSIGEAI